MRIVVDGWVLRIVRVMLMQCFLHLSCPAWVCYASLMYVVGCLRVKVTFHFPSWGISKALPNLIQVERTFQFKRFSTRQIKLAWLAHKNKMVKLYTLQIWTQESETSARDWILTEILFGGWKSAATRFSSVNKNRKSKFQNVNTVSGQARTSFSCRDKEIVLMIHILCIIDVPVRSPP